jgi:hypothetical protein
VRTRERHGMAVRLECGEVHFLSLGLDRCIVPGTRILYKAGRLVTLYLSMKSDNSLAGQKPGKHCTAEQGYRPG